MKIAIIRKKYNPFGGAERYLDLLAGSLTRSGHEVHVYANQWSTTVASGVVVHHVPMLGGLSLLKVWSFALFALAVVKRSAYDAILSNERLLSHDVFRVSDGVHRTWLAIRWRHAGWLKRVSLLVNPLHWSVRFLDWWVFGRRAFRTIVAPSEFVKRDILTSYRAVHDEDICVVYNGVDLERFRPENRDQFREMTRTEFGWSASQPVLLFVGTGFERKGLRGAIESLRFLPSNVILVAIGKGSTRRYRACAQRWGVISRVVFLGPRTGVERYYAAADLVVLPTLYEPMANVVLEALASGIPVVTSRNSGNAEILSEGEDGCLVDVPDDARLLAAAIERALVQARDPETARRARAKAERFSLQRAVDELGAVLSAPGAGRGLAGRRNA